MTRRGSLIYYLSAWILGCFFMSLAIWIKFTFRPTGLDSFSIHNAAKNFWLFCFIGWIFGAGPSLLGAFLLRRLLGLLHWRNVWQWTASGAALTCALLVPFGLIGRSLMDSISTVAAIGEYLFFFAPAVVLEVGWWLAIPAGAATAYLLCRIERRFAPPPASA
jgi:hypothetical protein